jgi:lysophospholipid acyltransferase (LPLAT)-like uncharacterized protein
MASLREKRGLNSPTATPGTVQQLSSWRRLLLQPLGLFVQLWGRTLRFDIEPEARRHLLKTDEAVAFILWHNRLFLVAEIFRRYRGGKPVYALISASKDGAWLAAFFSLIGIRNIRGSSSRLGREAVLSLVDVMRAGNDIGITPDGPRGPRYVLKAGAIVAARRAGATALLLGGEFSSAWRLGSWDGFYLPKPFSRVRVHCERVPAAEFGDERAVAAETFQSRLLAINPDRK